MDIKDLSKKILDLVREKGFGLKPDEINVGEKIALIHSELSEALDAYRKKRFEGADNFGEELADVIVRTLHLAGIFDIDIEKEIIKKIESNKDREWDWENLNEQNSL